MRNVSMPVKEVSFILRIRTQPRVILAVLLGWIVRQVWRQQDWFYEFICKAERDNK